jgi:hypothetical protein
MWRVRGAPPGAYAVDTARRPTDPAGGTASVRAWEDGPGRAGAWVSVSYGVPADTFRGRLVRASAELRGRDIRGGAALWVRVDGATGMPLALAGTDDGVWGTPDWTARTTAIVPVPVGAQRVVYGLRLVDGAAAEVRALRLAALPAPPPGAPLAVEARAVLDSALAFARRHALWRDTVTWAAVEPEVRAFAAGAQTPTDVYPAIRYLLSRLGDGHSSLQTARAVADLRAAGADNTAPEVRTLPGGVGSVAVPGYYGLDPGPMRAYATRLYEALAGAAPGARCGWVVDLRANDGGIVTPMLAGLKPFLGAGPVGSVWRPGDTAAPDTLRWIAGRRVDVEPPPGLERLEQAFVAVLTGPRTGSAGEIVAVAFRGRPRTRSFGAPTQGFSTWNERHSLPDGAALSLTTGVYVDRTGTRYGGAVVPDEPVPAPPTGTGGEADPTLDAATRWLRQASGCGIGRP